MRMARRRAKRGSPAAGFEPRPMVGASRTALCIASRFQLNHSDDGTTRNPCTRGATRLEDLQ
jgi:hypothetical protein